MRDEPREESGWSGFNHPCFGGLRVAQDTGCLVPMLARPLTDQDRVTILLPGMMGDRTHL